MARTSVAFFFSESAKSSVENINILASKPAIKKLALILLHFANGKLRIWPLKSTFVLGTGFYPPILLLSESLIPLFWLLSWLLTFPVLVTIRLLSIPINRHHSIASSPHSHHSPQSSVYLFCIPCFRAIFGARKKQRRVCRRESQPIFLVCLFLFLLIA